MSMLLLSSLAFAQDPPPGPETLEIAVGRSLVVTLPATPIAVSVTDPDVAGLQTLGTPTTLLVQGRALGTTDLVVVLPAGRIELWPITVGRDLSALQRAVDGLAGDAGRIRVEAPAGTK